MTDQTVEILIDDLDTRSFDDSWVVVSEGEQRRADRFARSTDRHRFVARRAFRRQVLGRVLGEDPADLTFEEASRGKPSVPGVEFSASSSGPVAVIAVTTVGPVGVDIEQRGRARDLDLLQRALAPVERERLSCADDQEGAFLRAWTRKEAVTKAIGVGLGVTPQSFEGFDVLDDQIADPRPGVDGEWFLTMLDVPEGYVGALATPVAIVIG